MFEKNDYRFCIKASLQVMKKQRTDIYENSINNYYVRRGLYEKDEKRQMLCFQSYSLEWLGNHWVCLRDIFDNHLEYSTDQKRDFALFYAEFFSKFLDLWRTTGALSKLAIPDILQTLKNAVEELIMCSDKWEEKSKKLELLIMGNEAKFEHLLSQDEE